MPGEIARQWFIPGEGIDRHVISADIQRYLGNDATVRPGPGTGENQGVNGYWIKAYRNLTSAMIADLRADSQRWRQEQRMTGTRALRGIKYIPDVPELPEARPAPRRDADSPSVDGPYAVPPSRGDPRSDRGDRDRDARMERERNQVSRRQPPDAMDIDPPPISERDRYGNPIAQPRAYQDRVYAEARGFPPNRSAYPQDQQMAGGYGPPPASSSYVQDSRYATSFPQSDGAPPGYVRQGQFYVPVTNDIQSGFVAPGRSQPQPYEAGPPYGQSQIQPGRDRERGPDPRDPRYGQPDFDTRDTSRYAYPSPAATVSSVDVRGRDSVTSPPAQASPYSEVPRYDQYGRPIQAPQNPYGPTDPGYQQPSREPGYGRERQPAAPTGDTRRRRLH